MTRRDTDVPESAITDETAVVALHRPTPVDRQHGIDTLRAVATLLVVALHAAVPYTLHPLPGLAWPTRSVQTSAALDALFWWIEGFIMPLFFVMTGYFAAQSLQVRGPGGLVASRVRRLLVPLFWGCLLILPCELYIWMGGWYVRGLIPLRKLQSLKLPAELSRDLWGLSHLWYLQYAFLLCACAAGCAHWWRRSSRGVADTASPVGTETQWPRTAAIFWGCTLACTSVLWAVPEVVTAFQHGFLPFAPKLLHAAIFFAAGYLLHRLPRCELRRLGWSGIVGSGVMFLWLLPRLQSAAIASPIGLDRLLLGLGMSVFATTAALGWFSGFASASLARSPLLQPIADSSLWIYLLHHPTVGLVHIACDGSPLRPEWQFIIAWTTAVALPLLAHRGFVLRRRRAADRRAANASVPRGAAQSADRRAA